ncbi:MAG TPA: carboxypeptidase regulatory-like domain-containing protein, partial [Povalibacter sp.]|nr:carboxypeptidase regulatory-like domain-containing protein [Povalibacter sp.]
MIRKICAGALAFMLGAVSLQSEASTQWLLDQQQPDGAIARPTDVAIPIQSTSEALAALRLLGAASPATAEGYVLTDAYDGTEYLARKIAANANNPAVVAPLVTSLLSHQGVDGGFAERSGFQSSTLDTALALDAMSSAGRGGEPAALSAASFLLQAQRSDGSWTNATDPEVYITALSARSLFALRDRIPAINSAIVKANAFLLSRRSTDALWGEDWLSAQALLTLATTAIDVSAFQQSGDALKARRLPDTSWSDDVYTTALSLRAMFVFDARRGGAPLPSSGGAVAGYVLRAGTSEAITGVTVTAGGGAHAQSNAEGYFTISGIGAGDQTLTLQKEGYASASKVVIVRAGQISNAGSIYLAQSVNEALVRGRIIDGLSGEALGGVVIALSGPMSRSATSNAAGEFEITVLLPGTYSVSFTRTGYYAATGSLVAPAESVSEIRQGLVKEGAAQATGALDVSGRVVDASNGSALAGAVVRVDGSASTTASLGDGSFVLAALARGNHSVEISQSGFVTATYSFNLPPGASGALGNLALSPMTATQSPNSLTVVGHVIDGLDNRALAGASISVAQTGTTIVADAQGNFVLANLNLLSFDVSVTADGHQGRTFALAASGYGEVSGTFALSPLGGDPLATASTLHGIVRDSVTATPLAGASLRISGTALSALSNDAGEFDLTGVALKEFDLL